MPYSVKDKLVIAVASRALFNFDEEHQVWLIEREAGYRKYQLEHQEQVAEPGAAFPLVQKLLRFNTRERTRVEVVVLSRNDPASGLRFFNSTRAHEIKVSRGVFTRGAPPYRYLSPFNAVLFLSCNPDDVRGALQAGFAAAQVYPDP